MPAIAAIVVALFATNVALTAFGGLHPGKARRTFDTVATLALKGLILYIASLLLYDTFASLSQARGVRPVLNNIFSAFLVAVLLYVVLFDFFPSKKR